MKKSFTLSTIVLKLFAASLCMFVLFCAFIPAHAAEFKAVTTFESVRKNLWYVGVEGNSVDHLELHAYLGSNNSPEEATEELPEELERALIKEEENSVSNVL